MYKYSFEKLEVWQASRDLAVSVYKITADFPGNEVHGLTSQLRRASISIGSNIAEGTAYNSKKQQARFYSIAYASAVELINQLILSKELALVQDPVYRSLRLQLERITNMLNGLRSRLYN